MADGKAPKVELKFSFSRDPDGAPRWITISGLGCLIGICGITVLILATILLLR